MEQIDLNKHISYYKKLLQGLPEMTHSSYITTLFFIVSALDLLDKLDLIEKGPLIEWVYKQQIVPTQHPELAGFRPNSSTADLPESEWDYANLASTYCGLCLLIILGDDLSRVSKESILHAISLLQRPAGNFISHSGGIESDIRFIYCVCVICYILNDWEGLDSEKLCEFIVNCQSYEGGIGMSPGQESHGGSTYCGVSSLTLLNQLGALPKKELLIEWLLQRQGMGFQGRIGKMPDTCYGYWVGLSLQALGCADYIDSTENLLFYIECQAEFGGFSKYPGSSPDLVHSYLGLVGVAVLGHPGLRQFYGPLGMTMDSTRKLKRLLP